MDLVKEKIIYNALKEVFVEKAYSSLAFNKALKNANKADIPYITKVFYGVLERSICYDYIIDTLVDKPPKTAVAILIKIGLYLMRELLKPDYTAVNKTIELSKAVGKSANAGFINAVLKKSISISLPEIVDIRTLSIVASIPSWILFRLEKEYGFLQTKLFALMPLASSRTKSGEISAASKASVDFFIDGISPKKILDLCAAPGGKSVQLKKLLPDASVTSCDIHPHRIELIKNYARREGVELTILENDATVLREEFINSFDLVICDVPCSGIGVIKRKPDISFRPDNISELVALQAKILATAANYVKKGGRLAYSTCTIFRDENEAIVDGFSNPVFSKPLTKKLLPHIDLTDGFFMARWQK